MAEGKKSMKGFYGVTFLIGIGFFTMGLMDPLYDNYVPILLSGYIRSKGVIGTIMTLDNIFAIFLIPIVSALSDRTSTKIGRRMPYILVTLPLTWNLFRPHSLCCPEEPCLLIIAVFFLNIFKQSARGPVVALMPDTVPGDLRSEANGVIKHDGRYCSHCRYCRSCEALGSLCGTPHYRVIRRRSSPSSSLVSLSFLQPSSFSSS